MEATKIRPAVKVEDLGFNDPEFEAGSSHVAQATLTNPTGKEFTYTTELYLDVTKVATSGVSAPFTIPAGGSTTVAYTVVMPAVEGTYHVYLDVWVGTELIAHYQATEDITIVISPKVTIGPIIWG
jgi:hypothetical protein